MKFKEINIKSIEIKDNVRKDLTPASITELMQSIKEKGIVQPILVKAIKEDKYNLIAGFRRIMAAKGLGLQVVPCVIEDIADEDRTQVQIVENIQREDLNAVDEAVALSSLSKKHKIEDLALMIGKTTLYVNQRLILLSLPLDISNFMAMESWFVSIDALFAAARNAFLSTIIFSLTSFGITCS